MSIGTLESIQKSLVTIASLLQAGASLSASSGEEQPANNTPESEDREVPDSPDKSQSKKTASKKTASKKTASRKGKSADLSDITVFKKSLFDIAEQSGIDDVMPKLKAFIKSQDYGSSDEIEVKDRAAFLKSVTAHFAELAGDDDDEDEDELDSL